MILSQFVLSRINRKTIRQAYGCVMSDVLLSCRRFCVEITLITVTPVGVIVPLHRQITGHEVDVTHFTLSAVMLAPNKRFPNDHTDI